MIATMDDVQYNEHKLAEKAQRIIDIRSQLNELENRKKELQSEKPTCEKENLTYKESIEFGKRLNNYKEKLRKPIKTFCILQAEDMSQSDSGNNIKIKKVTNIAKL